MPMDRIHGVERLASYRHPIGGKPRRTWDIFHVHPTGNTVNGVKYGSTVHCYMANARPDPLVFVVWVPGGDNGVEYEIIWGQEWWAPVQNWGIASVALVTELKDKTPIHFFWELIAGKA